MKFARRTKLRVGLVVASTAVLALAGTSVVLAVVTPPPVTGIIYACKNATFGTLRVVAGPPAWPNICIPVAERPYSWISGGGSGSTGATGPTGATGNTGATGP